MWPFHYNNMFYMQQHLQEQVRFANHINAGPPLYFPMVPITNERTRQLTPVEINNKQPPKETNRKTQESTEMELMEEETTKTSKVTAGSNAFKQLNLINKPNIMSKPSPVKVQPAVQETAPLTIPAPVRAPRMPVKTVSSMNVAPKVSPPIIPPPLSSPHQTNSMLNMQRRQPRHLAGWPMMSNYPTGVAQESPNAIPYEYKPTAAVPFEMENRDIDPNSWDLTAESDNENDNDDLKRKASVFSRLGPISEQKRAKLTINLLYNKDEIIRDVVEENKGPEALLPVTQRKDILLSTDETVIKFLPLWPWTKSKVDGINRLYKNQEKIINDLQSLEASYADNMFYKITVTGYPAHYKKEDVLDILIETVKDKTFVPCFIEFNPVECLFLTIRSRKSLVDLVKRGFKVNQDNFVMKVALRKSFKGLSHVDFIPRLIVRRRINLRTDEHFKADLSAFCLQPGVNPVAVYPEAVLTVPRELLKAQTSTVFDINYTFSFVQDISHFIYFPLNCLANQVELIHIHTNNFANLVELNLSNNRLTSILGFNLSVNAPKLHVLNLSNNYLAKFSELIDCKGLLLRSLTLEGNPLCLDFIHPREYTSCAKLLFPTLKKLDGVRIHGRCELAVPKRNLCPEAAQHIVDTLLDTYFPLLEESEGNRLLIADLYDNNALYTVNAKKRMQEHPHARSVFRMLMRSGDGCLEGSDNIARYISKWPQIVHDPESFKIYVMFHSERTTIVTIDGVLKVPSCSLAEEEPLVVFSRSLVLHSRHGSRYHIRNEIVYWDLPTDRTALASFVTTTRPKITSLQLESPDEELKKEIIDIFSKITNTEPLFSEQCLLKKKWDLTEALQYYMNIVRSSM